MSRRYSAPDVISAQTRIAGFLQVETSNIVITAVEDFPPLPSSVTNATSRVKGAARTPHQHLSVEAAPGEDKMEYSPNNRATCRHCNLKICKGAERVGKASLDNYRHWNMRYYHKECCPPTMLQSLNLPGGRSLEGHFEHAMVEHIQQEMIIRQRGELWNTLKNLRTHFASCEAVPPYCVFTNKALGSIVMRLPSTMIELRQCYGIGEQKCEKYGVDVLREVEAFVARNPNPTPIRQDLINRLHDSNAR